MDMLERDKSMLDGMRGVLTQLERVFRSELELARVRAQDEIASVMRKAGGAVVAMVLAAGGMMFLLYAAFAWLSARMPVEVAAMSVGAGSLALAGLVGTLSLRSPVDDGAAARLVADRTLRELSDTNGTSVQMTSRGHVR